MICESCNNRQEKSEYKDGICEVCRLQYKDTSIKKVKYCDFCKVNICDDCNTKYDQRFFAMIKNKFGL